MGYGLSRYPLNTGDVQFVGDVTVRITSPPCSGVYISMQPLQA